MGLLVRQSFDSRFVDKLKKLSDEYGEKLLELDGIGPAQLDINNFSEKFFSKKNVADISADANANVDDDSVLSFEYEFSKSIQKLNGYYVIWKKIVDKYGIKKANAVLDKCIMGGLKIHDQHMIMKSYSYYQETPIIIKINGIVKYLTLKQLFESYKEFVTSYDDREEINCNSLSKNIDFADNLVIVNGKKECFIKTDKINANICEIHNIEVLDKNSTWTKLKKIIRHKTESELIAYQTNAGDYAIVTDNHPVIMADNTEKYAKDLKIGDEVMYANNNIKFDEYINIDEDLAYLTGFIMGDGNISRHAFYEKGDNITNNDLHIKFSKLLCRFTIYQKNIKYHKICEIIKKIFPDVYCEFKNIQNVGYNKLSDVHSTEFNWVAFASKRYKLLCVKYFNLDYTNSSFTKTLPSNILNWAKKSKEALISGIIDSDGTIISNGVCNIQITSYAAINQLYDILKTISDKRINKRFCENVFKHEFAISFIPTDGMYEFSEKLKNAIKRDWSEYNITYDGNQRDNKIKKISIIDTSKLPKRLNELKSFEYAYDITTESGTFYANGMLQHNCYAFSLYELAAKGLPFIKKVNITPAKHLTSFIDHVIQFTAYASNQLAGASGFPDLFIYLDWYARKDYGDNYLEDEDIKKIIKQSLQSLIFSWNFPFRGSQSAFCNVNLYDKFFLKDLFENAYYPDNTLPDLESIKKLQEFYMRWFIKESETQTFTFPINTATFYKDENGIIQDVDFLDLVSELNCMNGTFNIFTGSLGILSSCCRLLSNSKQTGYTNSFGAAGVSIGSHRVVTINLPHIAYKSEDDEAFFKELDKNVRDAHIILDAQYDILTDNINKGKLPLYTHKFMFLQKQYSTIGFIGINEACELQKYDIMTEQGINFATKTLNFIAKIGEQLTAQDSRIRNMEQIPGESAAVSLAQKDKIIFHNHNYDMYANQYIPLWKTVDIQDRIRISGKLDGLCSGGGICHLNSSDSLTQDQMKTLINTAAKAGCIYYAVNMAFARCNTCQKLYIGKFEKSPCHNADMTHFMRVVGFLTSVENWIPERRVEYTKRQIYSTVDFK